MKLAKKLIRLMSDYYARNNLKYKMSSPVSEEYLEILKPDIIKEYLIPHGYLTGTDFDTEIKSVPDDLLLRVDLVIKGTVFLYLNEILSWNEVKKILNIGTTGEILYKKEPTDNLGAYDIVLPLLAVLFGTINYNVDSVPTYNYERLTNDIFYWDMPNYYYGYKAHLSYGSLDDILDNIQWFLDENPDVQTGGLPDKNGVLGMLRINDKFTQTVLEDNDLASSGIITELDDLGYYNVALNLIRIDDTPTFGLNNTLFDFYKAVTEETRYSDDELVFTVINWTTIRMYSKYVDTVMQLNAEKLNIEKIGNILRDIQHFLIH